MVEPSTVAVVEDEQNAVAPASRDQDDTTAPAAPSLVEEDLLVEDVSIDGMCGVY